MDCVSCAIHKGTPTDRGALVCRGALVHCTTFTIHGYVTDGKALTFLFFLFCCEQSILYISFIYHQRCAQGPPRASLLHC